VGKMLSKDLAGFLYLWAVSSLREGNVKPLVSIIIVTYKALRYISICLDSIRKNTPEIPYEIIVVDNSGLDRDVTNYLSGLRDENLKVYFNQTNVLLTPAQNQGIGMMNPSSKCALFMMPDTMVLRPDWMELLLSGLEKDFVGITGPVCNYFPTEPLHGNIDMCCLMVTKQVLDKVSGLDENYPMDGGGLALGLAAYTRGYLYSHLRRPKIIVHYGGKSRIQNPMPRQKINRHEVFRRYGIKPRWSIIGLIRQIIMRPETVWGYIKNKLRI